MIEFHNIEINGAFRYLWLKYVTGHNLNVHCAQSLKGEYSTKINLDLYREKQITLDEFPAKILYLCGVANPYNWSRNFHLAMLHTPGETFDVAENGIIMTVRNAIPLPIETKSMAANGHAKLSHKRYSTCRNWQFANFLHATGILDAEQ